MSAVMKQPEPKEIILFSPESSLFTPDIVVGQFIPANINLDVDKMARQAKAWVESKRALVTPETIKDGKDTKADFNKQIKSLDDLVKKIDTLVDGEWSGQKARIKSEIKPILVEGMEVYKADIDKLEAVTKKEIALMLQGSLLETWDNLGVEDEFRHAKIDDLIKLTSRTPKGSLTNAALKEVGNKAQADYSLQTKIKSRLVLLEVNSLKHDIPTLSRQHVEPFLFADDFTQRLDALIAAEIARKAEAEERMRKKLETEKQREIEEALRKQQAEANRIAMEAASEANRIAQQAKDEADRIAMSAKVEADTQVNALSKTEALKADLERYSAMYARYPDSDTAKLISETKKQLGIVEETKPTPEGSVVYKVKVDFKNSHIYEFTSRPNADREKMKAFFTKKAQEQYGLGDGDILGVSVDAA